MSSGVSTSPSLEFQSTPPARGATYRIPDIIINTSVFQSTPPARGATLAQFAKAVAVEFQSTPPARGATQMPSMGHTDISISIHAPREGGDDSRYGTSVVEGCISIHAPREGGD